MGHGRLLLTLLKSAVTETSEEARPPENWRSALQSRGSCSRRAAAAERLSFLLSIPLSCPPAVEPRLVPLQLTLAKGPAASKTSHGAHMAEATAQELRGREGRGASYGTDVFSKDEGRLGAESQSVKLPSPRRLAIPH